MSFTSLAFPALFGITALFFFTVPVRLRWAVLLLSSYYFYMSWNVAYVALLFACTAINYVAALQIEASTTAAQRKRWLWLGIGSSLGMLGYFKYAGFLTENIQALYGLASLPPPSWEIKLLLPVGISFYTFQALSYTIDVYRNTQVAEKHFGKFALFVSFFPQLVAGPIERANHLLPQLVHTKPFNSYDATAGLQRMLFGYGKKLIIADNAALVVNQVYGNSSTFSGPTLLLATVLFAIQIYCDFSAYSDIAIGAARVLRIRLLENFNRPYAAVSVTDFWRRWHISLMLWFREYIYIPLGGNRVSLLKHSRNIALVFLISGIWHGASWTFILWGLFHGAFVWLEMLLKKTGLSVHRYIRWIGIPYTLTVVLYSWVLFRAQSIGSAVDITLRMTQETFSVLSGASQATWFALFDGLIVSKVDILLLLCFVVSMEVVQWCMCKPRLQTLYKNNLLIRWPLLFGLLLCIYVFGSFHSSAFIYFQF